MRERGIECVKVLKNALTQAAPLTLRRLFILLLLVSPVHVHEMLPHQLPVQCLGLPPTLVKGAVRLVLLVNAASMSGGRDGELWWLESKEVS